MEVQTWPIDKITVKDRIRQDLGDLDTLKESMAKRGLINPVAVKRDGGLLAGERRLRAAQELGWAEIEVRVWGPTDSLEDLDIEAEENLCRKEPTPGERELYWQRRKKLLKPEAEAAMMAGKPSGKVPEGSRTERETAVKAAKGTGFSHKTLEKVEEVRTTAEDETQPEEVREEAQRQHQALMEGSTKATPAVEAVRAKKRRIRQNPVSKLAAGLGPGQWVEPPPPPKPEPSLTERLVNGIGKGQGLEKLAAEIQGVDLDLDDETVFVLRNRLLNEIAERKALKEALDQEIKKRGYSTRKRTL